MRAAAIAKAAEVSQSGLAHHIPSKDILVKAAIEYDTDSAEKRTRANLELFNDGANVFKEIIEDNKDYYFVERLNVALDFIDWGSQDQEMPAAK